MLNDVSSFYLKNDEQIWVQTMAKFHRPATEHERIEIQKHDAKIMKNSGSLNELNSAH